MIAYKATTHSLCSPIQGGEPIWDGTVPYRLPTPLYRISWCPPGRGAGMSRPSLSGWYILTPAGYSGPYRSRGAAEQALPTGERWPIIYVPGGEVHDGR